MSRATLVVGAAVALLSSNAFAQAKVNFTGTWTRIVDSTAMGGGGGGGRGGGRGGLGNAPTISQDDKTLTITRAMQGGEVKSVYNLDGSDSKNTITMGGQSVEQTSKAKWDGDKLVIATSYSFNGNNLETTQVLSIDASGNLVVQTTAPGRGGGAPVTTTANYKKG
jgi:hypothetical protein